MFNETMEKEAYDSMIFGGGALSVYCSSRSKLVRVLERWEGEREEG